MTCKLVQGKKKEQSFFSYDNQSTVSYAFKQFCHREKKNMPVLSNLNIHGGCSSARSRAFLAQWAFFFCYVEKVILTHKVWENVARVSVEDEENPVALTLLNSIYQTFSDFCFWAPSWSFMSWPVCTTCCEWIDIFLKLGILTILFFSNKTACIQAPGLIY